MVGLANVDNTTDLNKPISTATQTALNLKADLTNIGNFIGATATPNYFTGFPTNLPSWTCNAGSSVVNGSDYQTLSFPAGGWMFFSYINDNPDLLSTLTVSVKLVSALSLRILIVADPSRFTFDYTTELNTSSYTDLTMNFTPPLIGTNFSIVCQLVSPTATGTVQTKNWRMTKTNLPNTQILANLLLPNGKVEALDLLYGASKTSLEHTDSNIKRISQFSTSNSYCS
jgi:hypothetical protein